MPTSGTSPLRRANSSNARQSRPATIGMSTSPGRPPPPSANSTTGSRRRCGELEQAVLLGVVAHALRAGQDRVVVGHRHARAALRPRRRRPPGRRRACARSAPRACAGAPGRRTAAARTRRSCPRRAGRRGSRAPCAVRARGAAATASGRAASRPMLVALAHRAQVRALAGACPSCARRALTGGAAWRRRPRRARA